MRLKIPLQEYVIILPSVLAFAFIFQILSHSFYVTCTVIPNCTIECYAINYCTEYSAIRALPLKNHCSRLELKWGLVVGFLTCFLHWALYSTSQYRHELD